MPTIAGSIDGCSSSLVPINHKSTVTPDDMAFVCQIADRVNGRSQMVVYGILTGKGYKTGGVPCDLTALTSPGKFPLKNFRVVIQMDTTCTYYAVFNHSTNKMLIYSGVNSEVSNGSDIKALKFPFMAVGE